MFTEQLSQPRKRHGAITSLFSALLIIICSCQAPAENGAPALPSLPKDAQANNRFGIRLPAGFRLDLYAENIPDARSMARSDKETLFVGNRSKDKVYALLDTDNDFRADKVYVIAQGLVMPNGIAYHKGDLYVAALNRLLVFRNIDAHLDAPPKAALIYEDLPRERNHGWKYIAFGPDNKLYVSLGAPCNICLSTDPRFASILRMDPDGKHREIYAHGVRNSVGFDFDPADGSLWFTDNGRDWLGDDTPPCELNHATRAGQHFGYPYCHGQAVADPAFGAQRNCAEFTPPIQELGAHVAPLGMLFYRGSQFPTSYRGTIFIAEHGSWNRSKKVGYRISCVQRNKGHATRYTPFAEGWLDEDTQQASGRPVDLLELPDGSLLLSDDFAGRIYRISYAGS